MLETLQKMLYTYSGGDDNMTVKSGFSREGYLNENYRLFHLRDTAGQERDFHFHEFDKIVILISGKVDYAVEDKKYTLRPWDVLLIGHHTLHKALIDIKEPYERIIIYLDKNFPDRIIPGAQLSECFDAADRRGQNLLSPNDEQRESLKTTLEALESNLTSDSFGSKAMADTLLIQLIIQINRISAASPNSAPTGKDDKIENALSYINEHLSEKLTVDALAEKVYLSKYHFMRLFKENTGSTVHAYVRQKRLLYAARLIREGVNANKAASDAGFSDYSAFHRAFRESFSVNPGELKVTAFDGKFASGALRKSAHKNSKAGEK